jgi:hypothetical protein
MMFYIGNLVNTSLYIAFCFKQFFESRFVSAGLRFSLFKMPRHHCCLSCVSYFFAYAYLITQRYNGPLSLNESLRYVRQLVIFFKTLIYSIFN